jgi:catechol 2,3-dioxygenase-like lactoylglutathione lyase family enzyme
MGDLPLTSLDVSYRIQPIDTSRYKEILMARLQLALNVSDLDEAIGFYSKLFGTEPAKIRPGYANFAVSDPPLKLVLMEVAEARGHGELGALNHLGVEVETTSEVSAATSRLDAEGLPTDVECATTCCHAVQDKVWVSDPDGARWEVYTVLADAPIDADLAGDGACCTPQSTEHVVAAAPTGACC